MNAITTSAPQPAVSSEAASGLAPDHGSLSRATASSRSRSTARAWALAVLIFAGAMDIFIAIPAFNGLLRGEPWQSLICATAFALISVSAAFSSGAMFTQRKRPISIVVALATVAMVIALFFLRVQAAAVNSSTLDYEGGTGPEDGVGAELGIAVALAVAMLAVAMLAWVDGYKITLTPAEALFRHLERRLASSNVTVAELEGSLVRLNENQAMAEIRLDRLPEERDEAIRGLHAFNRELRELARTEVAIHLGNPTATSGLDLPLPDTTDSASK